jgi:hypothetical protein
MADGDPGRGSAPIRLRLGCGRQLGDEEEKQYSSEVQQQGSSQPGRPRRPSRPGRQRQPQQCHRLAKRSRLSSPIRAQSSADLLEPDQSELGSLTGTVRIRLRSERLFLPSGVISILFGPRGSGDESSAAGSARPWGDGQRGPSRCCPRPARRA